jgi:hypothetical protein
LSNTQNEAKILTMLSKDKTKDSSKHGNPCLGHGTNTNGFPEEFKPTTI